MFNRPILISIPALLLICNFVFAYDMATWNNNAGDNDWHNYLNWQCSTSTQPPPPTYGNCVPDLSILAFIEPGPSGPNIAGDVCCSELYVHPWSWIGAPNATVNILPSAGLVNCGYAVNICAFLNVNSDNAGHGIINMYGGTVYTSITGTDAGLAIGGGLSKTYNSYGVLNMYGGLMSVPKIAVYYGVVNLYDGVLEGTSSSSSDFIVSNSKSMTRINVAGGTLKVAGDRTEFVFKSGRIVPYDQRGYLLIDFNYLNPGYTTVTAIYDLGVAYNPTPYYNQIDVNKFTVLTWNPGQYAAEVNGHQLYLGTSFSDVNDGNDNVYIGAFDSNHFTVQEMLEPNTTYYWRIDEVNDNNINSPWKGNIWFFATDSNGYKAYNPNPVIGKVEVALNPTVTWTPGYYAGTHQVYLGTNFADVNNADTSTAGIYLGDTDVNNADLSGLDVNTVYYWRIDEVNDSRPDSPWKGDIWNFRTTPCHGFGLTGDLNGDCKVNIYDMKLFSQQWLTAGTLADIYLDGKVDFKDYVQLANNWLVTQY